MKNFLKGLQLKYLSLDGRVDRSEYLIRMVILFIVGGVAATVASVMAVGLGLLSNIRIINAISHYVAGITSTNGYLLVSLGAWAGTFAFIFAAAIVAIVEPLVLVSQITLCVRRFHDLNMKGYWVLAGLIPGICPIMVILLALVPTRDKEEFAL